MLPNQKMLEQHSLPKAWEELDKKINKDKVIIVDDLTTSDPTKMLSANQGVVLWNAIQAISGGSGGFDTLAVLAEKFGKQIFHGTLVKNTSSIAVGEKLYYPTIFLDGVRLDKTQYTIDLGTGTIALSEIWSPTYDVTWVVVDEMPFHIKFCIPTMVMLQATSDSFKTMIKIGDVIQILGTNGADDGGHYLVKCQDTRGDNGVEIQSGKWLNEIPNTRIKTIADMVEKNKTDIATKSPINSPVFTGIPKLPTGTIIDGYSSASYLDVKTDGNPFGYVGKGSTENSLQLKKHGGATLSLFNDYFDFNKSIRSVDTIDVIGGETVNQRLSFNRNSPSGFSGEIGIVREAKTDTNLNYGSYWGYNYSYDNVTKTFKPTRPNLDYKMLALMGGHYGGFALIRPDDHTLNISPKKGQMENCHEVFSVDNLGNAKVLKSLTVGAFDVMTNIHSKQVLNSYDKQEAIYNDGWYEIEEDSTRTSLLIENRQTGGSNAPNTESIIVDKYWNEGDISCLIQKWDCSFRTGIGTKIRKTRDTQRIQIYVRAGTNVFARRVDGNTVLKLKPATNTNVTPTEWDRMSYLSTLFGDIKTNDNGYATFPNGLKIQWGKGISNNSAFVNTTPIILPTAFSSASSYTIAVTDNGAYAQFAVQQSKDRFIASNRTNTHMSFSWLAIGY